MNYRECFYCKESEVFHMKGVKFDVRPKYERTISAIP